MYHKPSNEKIQRFVPETTADEAPRLPRHLRAFFLPELWESTRESFEGNLMRAKRTEWTGQGLEEVGGGLALEEKVAEEIVSEEKVAPLRLPPLKKEKENENEKEKEKNTENEKEKEKEKEPSSNNEIVDHSVAMDLLTRTTLVLGMHPDQAAGPIVEFAVLNGIDFAVVPCCVYSDEFPKRKMKSGKRVTSYDDLCQYLEELAPPGEIQRCVIPHMEGKNVCLYRVTKTRNVVPSCGLHHFNVCISGN
jgi:hypothetical protein